MAKDKNKESRTVRRHRMSEDDVKLWEKVARSTKPLKDDNSRTRSGSQFELSDQDLEVFREAISGDDVSQQSGSVARSSGTEGESRKEKASPELARFNRREAKQLAGGRLEVEAKLDLHGYRQTEAHDALKLFLQNAQSRGLRHVLVITGKGRTQEEESFYFDSEKGVLKRQVPAWLDDPEFRSLVVSYSPASRRHGGEGALYIRIRRLK